MSNTIFSVLYAAIADALNTNTTLGYVDLDTGQLDDPANDYPIDYAVGAAFIDVEQIEWTERTGRLQNGTCTLVVSLAFQVTADTYAHSSERTAALALFDKIGNVHVALQYLEGEGFNKLIRISSTRRPPATTRPGLYVVEQRYVCDVREELPAASVIVTNPDLVAAPGPIPMPVNLGGYSLP